MTHFLPSSSKIWHSPVLFAWKAYPPDSTGSFPHFLLICAQISLCQGGFPLSFKIWNSNFHSPSLQFLSLAIYHLLTYLFICLLCVFHCHSFPLTSWYFLQSYLFIFALYGSPGISRGFHTIYVIRIGLQLSWPIQPINQDLLRNFYMPAIM